MRPLLLLFCAALTLTAQDAQKQYETRCAGCHGAEGEGSDRAPKLTGTRRLRSRTAAQIQRIIYEGVPSAGMPSFHLKEPELTALVSLVRSWNAPAADSTVPGDAKAGAALFQQECANCHMVQGSGRAQGPDLSNTGREMTVAEIRGALLHPEAHITPGYELVQVKLKSGETLQGFARNQTNYDLQLQDTKTGQFHLLTNAQIDKIQTPAQKTTMPAYHGTADQTRDLVAYLSTLTNNGPHIATTAEPAQQQAPVFARLLAPKPGDWLSYNGRLNGNRYSDLTQINAANVHQLAPRWVFPVDHFGLEATPVVIDGVMYITGPNQAWALDAATGRAIWHYGRPRSTGLVGDASLGTNRGVALLGDKVFMVMDNAHLIALNRFTGGLVWDAYMPEEPMKYGSTVAPLIVKDMVIAGVSGGDWGIRGFIAAFNVNTGERLWRHWTVPRNGEPGIETWKGSEPVGGGGSTWLTGAYDASTDTLFWPTGNPWPDSDDRDRQGDNLYTNCILALNPADGQLKWHYQFTPHDTHDWDATEPPLLIDTNWHGEPRKLLLHGDRNGIFYVLDRTNGKVLVTHQFVHKLNWTAGIDLATGRPLPAAEPMNGVVCPADSANWGSAVFSPRTHLYYFLTMDQCRQDSSRGGNKTLDPAQKFLRAIDIETGKVAWEIPQIGTVQPKTWPGLLATAGGFVLYEDPNGAVVAIDEKQGKALWHFPTNVLMKASPMTYMANGKQYIALAVGPNIMAFALPSP